MKKYSKNLLFYFGTVLIISLLYSFYISNIASFHSDWAAYYLFLEEMLKNGVFSDYFMPPTPALFQLFFYMLPVYLLFGISYKTFYLVIFFQTFVNVFVFGFFLKKMFPPIRKKFPFTAFLILLVTLTGPLLKIFDLVMFRKDIPLLLLIIYYLYEEIKFNSKVLHIKISIKIIIYTLFLSVQAFGDPFVTYMFLIPLILTNLAFFIINSESSITLLHITLISIISISLSTIMRLLTANYVFNLYSDTSQFIALDKLLSNITVFFSDINYFFPFLGFFGKSVTSPTNIEYFLNITILFLFLIAIFYNLRKSIQVNNPFLFFISSLPIISSLIYIFSVRPGADSITVRYHILFVFIIYIVIFDFLRSDIFLNKKIKFLTYFCIFIHLFLNLKFFTASLLHQFFNFNLYNKLDANVQLLDVLNKKSLKKGFAGYWDSSNNTYYSRNKIAIRPILCNYGEVIPFYWFSFKHWYEPEKNEVQTFVYVDKSAITHTSSCEISALRHQFGEEIEAIEFEPSKFIYIWNYDISSKINKINNMENLLMK